MTKVATQGRQDADQWVTKYTLSYSLDGMHWAEYMENSVTWVRQIIQRLMCRDNKIWQSVAFLEFLE